MSTEKRTVLFVVLSLASVYGSTYLLTKTGVIKPPPPPDPAAVAEAEKPEAPAVKVVEKPKADAAASAPAAEVKPAAANAVDAKRVDPEALVMGSVDGLSAAGYRMQVKLDQRGAGVATIRLAGHDAEAEFGKRRDQKLDLIAPQEGIPPSFALNLDRLNAVAVGDEDNLAAVKALQLDDRLWEVVPDAQGRLVAPVLDAKGVEIGRRVSLRTSVGEPAVAITKTFTLLKGSHEIDLAVKVESPGGPAKVAYTLNGPHTLPIEGAWHTSTFRDTFVALKGGKLATRTAGDVVKDGAEVQSFESLPLDYAGVEVQYFAVVVRPVTEGIGGKSIIRRTVPTVVIADEKERQKSDVSVAMTSQVLAVGPNAPATHAYRIYAGPKRAGDLATIGAEELATFRQGWQLPVFGAVGSWVAQNAIAPLLTRVYDVTATLMRPFGAKRGSYAVAIILLTMLIRLCLFPISRQQALMAKKMQMLQPILAELKEKNKDDKERYTKEMFATQRKYGVNMLGGCLPALFQIPIFIGLWQALRNSVALRHSTFLWIKDLSAPDMLAKFPAVTPTFITSWLGPYFNVLPLLVVGLMLVQTKLFSPPATTPEQEASQKMMKYMMVFMAFMFYKVPSGLGIYFITSSSWAICERLLLNRKKIILVAREDKVGGGGMMGRLGGGGRLSKWMEKIMDEAGKDATFRKTGLRPAEPEVDRPGNGRPRPKSPGKRR